MGCQAALDADAYLESLGRAGSGGSQGEAADDESEDAETAAPESAG
jgi:hypothetical protein